MAELLTVDALSILAVAFFVSIVVGMTGMGGGALMTPALIFLGLPAKIAVANDLVAAAVYKSSAAGMHWREGSPNFKLAGWLMLGSVPCALSGGFIVQQVGSVEEQDAFLETAIGIALLIAASTYTLRIFVTLRETANGRDRRDENPPIRPMPTLAIGAVGGFLVGLTSVGSGSVIMVTLLLLYPGLQAVKLVGTDLVQAVPLVLAAALGYILTDGLAWEIFIPLVVGGVPGSIVGSKIANRVPQTIIRRGIVLLLTITGMVLLGVNEVYALIIGLVLFGIGTVVWAWIRRMHGLPSFNSLGGRAEDKEPVGSDY